MGVVDKLKGVVGGGDGTGEDPYVCTACGTGYEREREFCSQCGSGAVERR